MLISRCALIAWVSISWTSCSKGLVLHAGLRRGRSIKRIRPSEELRSGLTCQTLNYGVWFFGKCLDPAHVRGILSLF